MKYEETPARRPRYRSFALAALLAALTVAAGSGERAAADGSESLLTVAAGTGASLTESALGSGGPARDSLADTFDWLDGTTRSAELTGAASSADQSVSLDDERAAAEVAPAPQATVAPARTTAPQPVRVAPPAPPAAPTAAPLTCAANWFCYPRLGIAGPIVPYTDCSGSTDVGTGIRSYSCLSNNYLMGHAYTQFGLVRQWAAGDIVFAWGQRFTVTGAVTQQSCAAPSFPLAPLSMQTSLTSSACGAVLVVQAR